MRERQLDQMLELLPSMEHPPAEKLQRISDIIEANPIISQMVWQDLSRDVQTQGAGGHGMSADQVLRAAIEKQTAGCRSYKDLAFHIPDSRCCRHFCQIGFADEGAKKSDLDAAINAISPLPPVESLGERAFLLRKRLFRSSSPTPISSRKIAGILSMDIRFVSV